MARLLDDIRRFPLRMPGFVPRHLEEHWATYARKIMSMILPAKGADELPVVLIDNVADYYFRVSDQEMWDITTDFPNLATPYPAFWVEHKLPKLIHSKQWGDSDVSDVPGRAGFFVMALDPKDVTALNMPEGTKWIYVVELFIDLHVRGAAAAGPHGCFILPVSAEGRPLSTIGWQTYTQGTHWPKDMLNMHFAWLNTLWLAISFMHCKNVALEDHPVPEKLAKKFEKTNGFRPVAHRTLVIEPLKAILRTEGKSETTGLKQAMHICRGHFADYTEGRGLFGKYHGRFWMPMHVKGSKGIKPAAPEVEIRL